MASRSDQVPRWANAAAYIAHPPKVTNHPRHGEQLSATLTGVVSVIYRTSTRDHE